jgi:hypothetical protein
MDQCSAEWQLPISAGAMLGVSRRRFVEKREENKSVWMMERKISARGYESSSRADGVKRLAGYS